MPRTEYFDSVGNLLSVEDDRSLAEAQSERLAALAKATSKAITAEVADYEQWNCANGIYDSNPTKKAAILGWINDCKAAYDVAKAQALTASTNEAIDSVVFVSPSLA